MVHEWKAGDWCEHIGLRWLVVRVVNTSSPFLRIVNFEGGIATPELTGPKHLPDCTGWDWQPKPAYRPFASALEFAPHSLRLIVVADSYSCVRRFSESAVDFGTPGKQTYGELFKYCQFADIINGQFVYSPCGIEVSK